MKDSAPPSFFSIIIPLYNKENYIVATLNSVLNQTFPDFEIIIIDDGSTDNSLKKVEEFKDDRVTIINQPNQGASIARNNAIKASTSNLIVFLDADDYWLPNHLQELKDLYTHFPNCGMYCSRFKTQISKNKYLNNSFSYSIDDDFRGIVPDFFEASLINRVAQTSCLMIPKHILVALGMFDANISSGQDLDLWIKIAIKHAVAITNTITAVYRFEIPNSLSKTSFLKKKIINLDKFTAYEKENKSLKKFIDLYRLEYAVQYRLSGEKTMSNDLLKKIESNIPLQSTIILNLPLVILRALLKLKQKLKNLGISFSIYH